MYSKKEYNFLQYRRNALKKLYRHYLSKGEFEYAHAVLKLLNDGGVNEDSEEGINYEPLAEKLRGLHCYVYVIHQVDPMHKRKTSYISAVCRFIY